MDDALHASPGHVFIRRRERVGYMTLAWRGSVFDTAKKNIGLLTRERRRQPNQITNWLLDVKDLHSFSESIQGFG